MALRESLGDATASVPGERTRAAGQDADQQIVIGEQIRLFYRASARTPYGLFVLLAVLAQFSAEHVPGAWPYLWAVAVAGIYAVRGVLTRRALEERLDGEALQHHCQLMLALTTAGGASAGAGILAFFPMLSPVTQAIVTMLCVGWIAGAVGISSVYPRFFLRYITPFGGCLLAAWLLFGFEHRWTIVFLLLLLMLYLWKTTREIGAKTEESIRIRFENVDLLQDIEARGREIEEASQAKSRFMAAASHDLRQPLMSLNLIYGRLLRAPDHADAMSVAAKLNTPIQTLESILDSLVEISRLDSGAVIPHHDTVDLESFARGLDEEFVPRATASGVAWHVDADPGSAVFDSHLAARVLRNLIDNAFKFTTAGSIHATVRKDTHGTLRFEVTDTGCGIPEAHIDHVFDEYFQVENPHRARAGGLGLGLAIVKRLVGVLGGSIRVHSVEGRGTTFEVAIPTGASHVAGTTPSPQEEVAATVRGRELKLLFVEDDPDLQDAIALWAEGGKAGVLFATDATEALALAASVIAGLDIVVSDYRLPGSMNGMQVIRALRERRSDLPAILLTGDATADLAEEARRNGVSYMAKPVSAERLEQEIRRVVAGGGRFVPNLEVRDV